MYKLVIVLTILRVQAVALALILGLQNLILELVSWDRKQKRLAVHRILI